MALGMLQESPVDEEDGSSCRRASNLIRNIVLSLDLLLIMLVVVRLVVRLANCLVAILVVTLAHMRCGSASAKRAIGSHVIRGEVHALGEDVKAYGHAELEEGVDIASELAGGGFGRPLADFG
ncbi:hypothetical protein BJ912DRAFT_1062790 [Pholiota molesta]|nr:hypothetical protein BJ912DRAFT_1062790 [Pholiota molesta]